MILVELQGGIGNQMFQYAFARSLSIKLNVSLKIDLSCLKTENDQHTLREYELEVFNIKAEIASASEVNKFARIHTNSLLKFIHSYIPFAPYYQFKEKQFRYMSEVEQVFQKNIWIKGFWQTAKYFESIKNIIREDFTFKAPLTGLNAELENQIKETNAVSIHIRRGDYITNPETNQYHGVCDIAYYKEALNYISSKNKSLKLFVFSDEPEWVKENLQFDYETIYVTNNTGSNSHNDLRLMSLCKHNIVANSSFSWWGAWLNNHPDKIVIAPKEWFKNKSINTADLIPEQWIRI